MKEKRLSIRSSAAEFLVFEKQSHADSVEVFYRENTLWMTQKMMGKLFDCSPDNIGLHLKNIFESEELDRASVTEEFSATASDGKNYLTKFYSLDAIISVGYRVNSIQATQFRKWATQVLSQFTQKGYVIDRKRMESGAFLGEDYYEKLLEEIQEIRISERRFYQKLTDIYATRMDYDKDALITQQFFAKVQNQMHYAVSHNTAAEIVFSRADSQKEHMGLTSWRNSPNGKILKSDVSIAKNYLTKDELKDLSLLVNGILDFAESRARRHIPMTMKDWASFIERHLLLDERDILKDAGRISAEMAKDHAETEFEKYRVVQDQLFESDFDRLLVESEEVKKLDAKTNEK